MLVIVCIIATAILASLIEPAVYCDMLYYTSAIQGSEPAVSEVKMQVAASGGSGGSSSVSNSGHGESVEDMQSAMEAFDPTQFAQDLFDDVQGGRV